MADCCVIIDLEMILNRLTIDLTLWRASTAVHGRTRAWASAVLRKKCFIRLLLCWMIEKVLNSRNTEIREITNKTNLTLF